MESEDFIYLIIIISAIIIGLIAGIIYFQGKEESPRHEPERITFIIADKERFLHMADFQYFFYDQEGNQYEVPYEDYTTYNIGDEYTWEG